MLDLVGLVAAWCVSQVLQQLAPPQPRALHAPPPRRPKKRPDTHRARHKKQDVDEKFDRRKRTVHVVVSSMIGDLLVMCSADNGRWEFLGGKCRHGKHGDRTLWNTAAREASEEAGTWTTHGKTDVCCIFQQMRDNPDVRISLVWNKPECSTILIVLPVETRRGVMDWLKLKNRDQHNSVRMTTQHSEEHTGYAFLHWTELKQGRTVKCQIGSQPHTFVLQNKDMYHPHFLAAIRRGLP